MKDVVIMDNKKFIEFVETTRLTKSREPNFSIERFLTQDLTQEQKARLVEALRRPWMENSLFYGYYENDYF